MDDHLRRLRHRVEQLVRFYDIDAPDSIAAESLRLIRNTLGALEEAWQAAWGQERPEAPAALPPLLNGQADPLRGAAAFLLWQYDQGGALAESVEAWEQLRSALAQPEGPQVKSRRTFKLRYWTEHDPGANATDGPFYLQDGCEYPAQVTAEAYRDRYKGDGSGPYHHQVVEVEITERLVRVVEMPCALPATPATESEGV
jgi:hypothetical protein